MSEVKQRSMLITAGTGVDELCKDFTCMLFKMLQCMLFKSLFEKFNFTTFTDVAKIFHLCYMYHGGPRP